MTHHQNMTGHPVLRGSRSLTGNRSSFTAGSTNITGTAEHGVSTAEISWY
jgi:hypothetical protein